METSGFLSVVVSVGSCRTGRAILAIGLVAMLVGCASRGRAPQSPVSIPAQPTDEGKPSARSSPEGVHHVVQRGQTLWRIAHTYGVGLDALARVNGITDPTRLEVGRRLFIPGATTVREVPLAAPAGVAARLTWPVRGGALMSRFGVPRGGNRRHTGIDIDGETGDPVLAAHDGRVVYSGSSGDYGKTVIVEHKAELRTLYAHNAVLLVREGERVKRGQHIARVGRTGNASGDHCHFEVRRKNVPVDPMPYFARNDEATQ
ncbi:MAG: peptidoglycan DD-metalloendopeptidase family protein [bacterium]|nr:peptidoglycan DD-metalloendopeptidase family protein [bacterium]